MSNIVIQKPKQEQRKQPKKSTTRYERGLIIATENKIVKVQNENKYWVQAQSNSQHFYNVKVTKEGLECDCIDAIHGPPTQICKHCYSVIIFELKQGAMK